MTGNTMTYSSLPVNEIAWSKLYSLLYSLVTKQVYTFPVSSWYGQEHDVIDDIVQETIRRMMERLRNAEQGKESPVQLLDHMIMVIAQNYCRDLRRRDWRIVHYATDNDTGAQHELRVVHKQDMDLSEEAIERVFQEKLFVLLAQQIACFPHKQREVLLADLANRMSFEEQLTPLQQAFLDVGIRLQEYQGRFSKDSKQRARQAALLHHAYKRVTELLDVQVYTSCI